MSSFFVIVEVRNGPQQGRKETLQITLKTTSESFERLLSVTFALGAAPVQLYNRRQHGHSDFCFVCTDAVAVVGYGHQVIRDCDLDEDCWSHDDSEKLLLFINVPTPTAATYPASAAPATGIQTASKARKGRGKTQAWMATVKSAAAVFIAKDGNGKYYQKAEKLAPHEDIVADMSVEEKAVITEQIQQVKVAMYSTAVQYTLSKHSSELVSGQMVPLESARVAEFLNKYTSGYNNGRYDSKASAVEDVEFESTQIWAKVNNNVECDDPLAEVYTQLAAGLYDGQMPTILTEMMQLPSKADRQDRMLNALDNAIGEQQQGNGVALRSLLSTYLAGASVAKSSSDTAAAAMQPSSARADSSRLAAGSQTATHAPAPAVGIAGVRAAAAKVLQSTAANHTRAGSSTATGGLAGVVAAMLPMQPAARPAAAVSAANGGNTVLGGSEQVQRPSTNEVDRHQFIRPRVPAPPPQDKKQSSTQQAHNGSKAAGQQQHVTVDGSRGRGRGARTGRGRGAVQTAGTRGRGGRGGRGRGMRGGSTAKETVVDGVAGNEEILADSDMSESGDEGDDVTAAVEGLVSLAAKSNSLAAEPTLRRSTRDKQPRKQLQPIQFDDDIAEQEQMEQPEQRSSSPANEKQEATTVDVQKRAAKRQRTVTFKPSIRKPTSK